MLNNVISAGGIEPTEPQDHGWMYGRSFQDIDGHLWEIFMQMKVQCRQVDNS